MILVFFVGPMHYYFIAPFYVIFSSSPWYGLGAVWAWKILGLIVVYRLVSNFFGKWQAWGVGWMMAVDTGVTCWNAMYISAISLFAYLLLQNLLQKHNKKWYLAILLVFFGVLVHFSMAAALIPTIFAWVLLISCSKTRLKDNLMIAAGFFLLLLPIIVFDIRHDFINLHNIWEMLRPKVTSTMVNDFGGNFIRSLGYFWDTKLINQENVYWGFVFSLMILMVGFLWCKKVSQKLFHLIWVLSPIILLSKYRGNISEYYFMTTCSLLILFTGLILGKLKFYGIIIALGLLVLRFQTISSQKYFGNLQTKLNIVNNLQKYRKDPTISVSYELPIGQDNGFEYLFKKNIPGFRPDGSGHLYTVTDRYQKEMGQQIFQEGIFVVYRK